MTRRKTRRLGQALTEYIIVVGLLAFGLVAGTKAFATALNGAYDMAQKELVGIEAEMAKQDLGTGGGGSGPRSVSLTDRKAVKQHRQTGIHTWTYDAKGRYCSDCGQQG